MSPHACLPAACPMMILRFWCLVNRKVMKWKLKHHCTTRARVSSAFRVKVQAGEEEVPCHIPIAIRHPSLCALNHFLIKNHNEAYVAMLRKVWRLANPLVACPRRNRILPTRSNWIPFIIKTRNEVCVVTYPASRHRAVHLGRCRVTTLSLICSWNPKPLLLVHRFYTRALWPQAT